MVQEEAGAHGRYEGRMGDKGCGVPRPEAAVEAKEIVCCSEGHRDSGWIGVLLHRLLPGVRKGSLLPAVQEGPSCRL